MVEWTKDQLSYFESHNATIDENGIVHFPNVGEMNLHDSFTHPGKKSLMIPGCVLIFETLHFVIEGGN